MEMLTAESMVWNREDRDLLIELRTEMKGIREDIRDFKNGTDYEIKGHEGRIRSLEIAVSRIMTWGSAVLIGLGVLQIILEFVIKR